MRVVLVSTYDLGHQPFGLASPAAWLRKRGHSVLCLDLACSPFDDAGIANADAIAFHLPMHTATRLAAGIVHKIRALNHRAKLIGYGLYAPLQQEYLRKLGFTTVIGGEYEQALVNAVEDGGSDRLVVLDRLPFITPDRAGLPSLESYSHLNWQGRKLRVGYTEASRGCKHLCRHCPVVPVYEGRFRVVPADVVLDDVRAMVAAGAEHITFGDPDFFNGPGHARRVVEGMHIAFPHLSYDVTIKVEHLLQHRDMLPLLHKTGCLFITSAVESIDDDVLARLDKGHTAEDFRTVLRLCRDAEIQMQPTFVAFHPWTTVESYRALLREIAELDLITNVPPIQLALRLLIPPGSLMLNLPEVKAVITGYDDAALLYKWQHPDKRVDVLAERVFRTVARSKREEAFERVWEVAWGEPLPENYKLIPRAAIPYMDEPWYC